MCAQGIGENHDSRPKKPSYIGAPAYFLLEQSCRLFVEAYGFLDIYCLYVVGSSLERSNWRDVDVRCLLEDRYFERLFPNAHTRAYQFDAQWQLFNTAVSLWMRQQTGLPVDFQIQPRDQANKQFPKGDRQAIGFTIPKPPSQQIELPLVAADDASDTIKASIKMQEQNDGQGAHTEPQEGSQDKGQGEHHFEG